MDGTVTFLPKGEEVYVTIKRNRVDLTEEQALHLIGVMNSYGIAKHLSWDTWRKRDDGVQLYRVDMEFEGQFVDWSVD